MNIKTIFLWLMWALNTIAFTHCMELSEEALKPFPFTAFDKELKIYILTRPLEEIIDNSEDEFEAFETLLKSRLFKTISLTSKEFRALIPILRNAFIELLHRKFFNPFLDKSLEEKNEILQEIFYSSEQETRSPENEILAAQAVLAGANINLMVGAEKMNTLLIQAINAQYVRFAQLLIELGANVNATNKIGYSPLMTAIKELTDPVQLFEIVKSLLEHGADPNIKSASGVTALALAIFYNYKLDIEVIELLLEYKADVTIKDVDGNTPLSLAKEDGDKELVALLRKAKLEALLEQVKKVRKCIVC